METELSHLIERIKKEGVEEAEKRARDIVCLAENKEHTIIAHAENESKRIKKEAEEDADRLKKLAEESIRQSLRDAVLSLKEDITGLFDSVLKHEIKKQLTPDFLKDVITSIIQGFVQDKGSNLEILLNKDDKEKLEEFAFKALSDEMKEGVTFKSAPNIGSGFRAGEKGKNYYYEFTDEALCEVLKTYLNPKISEYLSQKSKNAK